jgi:hypothetical protein
MTPGDLAQAARRELRARERTAGWDAADIAAWRTIAALLAEPAPPPRDTDWRLLVAAANAAEDRRIAAWIEARAALDPKLPAIEARLVATALIRRHVEITAAWHGTRPPVAA